eukprot:TRINITY_DN31023_c0_g1_i1.p1 TRINITY_DN31023_c0_g1~~TRINITY_DN31023_c0_g1_i1.p1  ORF type:complete len:413 (-),score=59.02 TRINITY_DN31023_c0_g1_i1:95-1273(-)
MDGNKQIIDKGAAGGPEPLKVSGAKTAAAVDVTPAKRALAAFCAILAGCLLVTQNGINTNLRRYVVPQPIAASLLSFFVGLVAISIVAFVHSPRLGPTTLRKAPWYAYTGGVLGPAYVLAAILLSSRLGFAAFQLLAISGQLASGLICDGIGLLGLKKRRPTCVRVFATIAAVVATALTSSGVDVDGEPGLYALYCLAAFCAGTIFPVQACVNAVMSKHLLSPFRGVVVSFAGGVVTLFVYSCVLSIVAPQPVVSDLDDAEPWMFTGGLCGAIAVTCNVVSIPILGAASYGTIFLASQLSAAFVYDTLGAFGFDAVAPTWLRVCGVLLAIASAVLYQLPVCPGGAGKAPQPAASAPTAAGEAAPVAIQEDAVRLGDSSNVIQDASADTVESI